MDLKLQSFILKSAILVVFSEFRQKYIFFSRGEKDTDAEQKIQRRKVHGQWPPPVTS